MIRKVEAKLAAEKRYLKLDKDAKDKDSEIPERAPTGRKPSVQSECEEVNWAA